MHRGAILIRHGQGGKTPPLVRACGRAEALAPHQLRHAHAVEMSREGVPLLVIQRQFGHAASLSPRPTYAGSATPRSSTPSTNAQHR
ncbi:MAG: tyrosine-type recombinase/integrase [Solirubrobacterales bacterium]|nr:tyrosine-type recombinase/integrase [Solirubrobacterales bacterium]